MCDAEGRAASSILYALLILIARGLGTASNPGMLHASASVKLWKTLCFGLTTRPPRKNLPRVTTSPKMQEANRLCQRG